MVIGDLGDRGRGSVPRPTRAAAAWKHRSPAACRSQPYIGEHRAAGAGDRHGTAGRLERTPPGRSAGPPPTQRLVAIPRVPDGGKLEQTQLEHMRLLEQRPQRPLAAVGSRSSTPSPVPPRVGRLPRRSITPSDESLDRLPDRVRHPELVGECPLCEAGRPVRLPLAIRLWMSSRARRDRGSLQRSKGGAASRGAPNLMDDGVGPLVE